MCDISVIMFLIDFIESDEFKDKRILEVGSRYVMGSIRPLIEKFFNPSEYIGIDIENGKYVDKVLPAEEITNYFGENSFDVCICTEVLEHVKDWRLVIKNLKKVLKPEGVLYITTRSKGFREHAYPYDYWRFGISDMRKIFSDLDILALENDPQTPGVFLKGKKPVDYEPNIISGVGLFSVVLNKRTKRIPNLDDEPFIKKLKNRLKILKKRIPILKRIIIK